MFRSRFSLAIAAPCLAIATVVLLAVPVPARRENRPPVANAARAALEMRACYPVPTADDFAQFDLPGTTGPCVLIVSSLGDASQSYAVRLTESSIERPRFVPCRPLRPLRRTSSLQAPLSASDLSGGHGAGPVLSSAAHREFHLHVTDGDLNDPRQYAKVAADLIGEGEHVRVYLDSQIGVDQIQAGLVDEIIRTFDHVILPTSRRLLGEYRDVDSDGKFGILISPWLDRLQGGRTSLGGMARGSDFRPDLEPPLGNRSDLLYLNSNLRPNDHLRTLLAHEFAHAVCFSRRIAAEGGIGLPAEEDWLTEAIAHLSEDLHGFGWSNLDHRVARFLKEPESAPLVVADYYRSGLWRDAGCRGATYLFLRWCVDQFGEELLGRLAAAPGRGTANLETVTGVPFPELYRRWTTALLLSGRDGESSPAASDFDGYRAIDLFGSFGARKLAGPRLTVWETNDRACEFSLRGTSTAFVVLPAGDSRPRRIHVQADSGTELQVSVVRLDALGSGSSSLSYQIARDTTRGSDRN